MTWQASRSYITTRITSFETKAQTISIILPANSPSSYLASFRPGKSQTRGGFVWLGMVGARTRITSFCNRTARTVITTYTKFKCTRSDALVCYAGNLKTTVEVASPLSTLSPSARKSLVAISVYLPYPFSPELLIKLLLL